MIKAKKYTLPGGLKLVLAPIPDAPTATVEVLVKTGSEYELPKESGISHFLEHMCFKGTEKRPSALALSTELDALGAENNAFTSTEVTSYYAKAGSQNVSKILDIVSDIYLNSVFKKEDVEKEKGVIIEELNMYDDKPEYMVRYLFERELHGNQPAGMPIGGDKKTVRSFTPEDLYAYRKKHYVASSTVISIAGRFNEKEIVKQVKELFKDISRSQKKGKKRTKIAHRGPRVVFKHKDSDQTHIVLGVRAFPIDDKRNSALSILRGVLSAGMSSRLFHRMRTELGICYYVYSTKDASTDHGEFLVSSGVDSSRIEDALDGIITELKRLKTDLVPEEELNKVKTLLISGMYMSLETSESVASYFGNRAMFYDDLLSPSEREQQINKVTAEEVRNVAKTIFTDRDLLLAVVGRHINEKALKKHLSLS